MPRVPDVACAGACGKLLWGGKTSLPLGQRTCLECRRATRLASSGAPPPLCGHCGDEFLSRARSDGRWTQACSKSCARRLEIAAGVHPLAATIGRDPAKARAKWQRTNRARRARLEQVESEPYSTDEIAERDGFRCGLCRRKVNMALRRPNPRSASIDHIVPLSKGGDDTRTNVQLAHLDCNVRKNNAMDFAQPLLIG